jgi:hypothetical protein
LKFSEDYIVKKGKTNKIDFNRIKYNRMTNEAEQDEYERKCKELKDIYCLYSSEESNVYMEITEAEFIYFNKLQEQKDKVLTEIFENDPENILNLEA